LTGAAADVKTALASAGITTVTNASLAVTVTGNTSVADINIINADTATGVVTATATETAAATLVGLTTDNSDLITITMAAASTSAANLNTIDGKTGVAVNATAITTITGSAGNDTIDFTAVGITYAASGLRITGGTGADTITLIARATVDTLAYASGDTALSIGGSGNNGTITGFDTIINFADGNGTNFSDALDFSKTGGGGASYSGTKAAATVATNGTDSTLTIGGQTVKSHAITSGGLITFDDADIYSSGGKLTLTSSTDLAAVIQYLQGNDIGDQGSTVLFAVGSDSYVFTQRNGSFSPNNGEDTLVMLSGVTATSLITTNAVTLDAIYIL
jgi:hypothetical protein